MIKVLSVARKNMRARAVIAVMAALFMASAVTAMERADKLEERVFQNIQLPEFKPTVVMTKYNAFIEGNEPSEQRKNQKIANIKISGDPIETKDLQRSKSIVPFTPEEIKDERTRVTDTDKFPNATNVFMEMFFGEGRNERPYNGSGVMIGPRHVLTAGHNVYDNDKEMWASHVNVSPGANEGKSLFGTTSVVKAFVPNAYFDGEDKSDLAVLVLEEDLGKYTGWASVNALGDGELEDTKFFVSGYPGDKATGQLWEMKGEIKFITPTVLKYKIATYAGQSGSPLWKKGTPPTVVGIHVRGGDTVNEATRISRERLDWIISCLTANSSSLSVKTGQQIVLKTEDSKPSYIEHPIPTLAKGYEEIYQRFFKGELIYRPQGIDKTEGEVRLRIADLKSPLEGTFDLSKCGDAGNYLSINTGYRKGKKQENANKVEIWLTPRFLVEKEQSGSAKHLQPIMSNWSKDISVGVLYTWGGWDDVSYFDYNIITSDDLMSKKNLYKILDEARCDGERPFDVYVPYGEGRRAQVNFHVLFMN